MKRIILNIGELAVSRDAAVLETILGSCVAVCLWDRVSRVGGLNHYLLPTASAGTATSTLYGDTSIDTLVAEMLKSGAEKGNIRGQIFGGGSVIGNLQSMFDIGGDNVRLARERLKLHGIPLTGEYVQDRCGIKVILKTASGETVVRPLLDGQEEKRLGFGAGAVRRSDHQPCKELSLIHI